MAEFDAKAPEYDSWYESKMGSLVDALETECAFRLFTARPGDLVLDAGCGTGQFFLKLAQRGMQVHGVDISRGMLEVARKKAAETEWDLHFEEMDLYALAFPDHHFDAVVSMAAFEFIAHPEKALSEFFRVVKPGGYVLVGTITADSRWGQQYQKQGLRKDSVFHYAHFKTAEEMCALFPDWLVDHATCVFFPPDTPEEAVRPDLEEAWAGIAKGAFVCVLWQKPPQASETVI